MVAFFVVYQLFVATLQSEAGGLNNVTTMKKINKDELKPDKELLPCNPKRED